MSILNREANAGIDYGSGIQKSASIKVQNTKAFFEGMRNSWNI